ncbi:MAG: suppressor of fused domain protein [Oscillospiraceae bacterium]|nr:suppressor of fused domain protein [Oscillospiraceae bacterium]
MGLFSFKKKNQKSNAEIFLNNITDMFGEPYIIRTVKHENNSLPISVMFWRDIPEEGILTSVTYGLSEANHPDWKYSKPEIILSLETDDESWGIGTAIFASDFQGEKSFTYGSIFTTDTPISNESEMTGFFVFAPSFLEQADATIHLPDYKVHLSGMYPIYKEEVDVYNEIGLEKFWKHPNFDLYNVNRKRVIINK